MKTPRHWYRLSIDLDPAGNPVGASYESHVEETTTGIHVLPMPEPFDSPYDALTQVLQAVHERHGIQLTLW